MKVSVSHHGKLALMGEFESTSAIHKIVPEFCPKPIRWGTFKNNANSHFYIYKFYNFIKGVPKPSSFCKKLAQLHSSHSSPEGKFRFHCTTYNSNLLQDNNYLRYVLKIHEDQAGRNLELNELEPYRNTGITDRDIEEGIVYNPASFWAHNEYELGNWRPERNKFTRRYFEAYYSHIPKAKPEEDYDNRNALYSLYVAQ
ncbi:hypothetical protein Trco_007748 [Trichoderma cornu-damae]|uniref:Protein-ribulosamine 3-kinase n=1 Tax=Trichoderma cornu-damae TaxID=654480 RepID=A0A9P8QL14_9HYPO|nr:hypothetical protein Trco_007748 [Trichoderma cornu-damae]